MLDCHVKTRRTISQKPAIQGLRVSQMSQAFPGNAKRIQASSFLLLHMRCLWRAW